MRLKNENLKTSVLKRPLESTASEFLMLFLVDTTERQSQYVHKDIWKKA